MPDRLDKEGVLALVRHIAQHITSPRQLTLFGGGAMALHELKESTKDVDAVVSPSTAYVRLISDLEHAGFDRLQNMDHIEGPEVHDELMTWTLFWSYRPLPNWQIDLFPAGRIWHRGFQWSTRMADRSALLFQEGHTNVAVADPSTILLLKSITGRWHNDPARDLPDIESIVRSGRVDWDFLRREWHAQGIAERSPEALKMAREAFDWLRDRGRHVPWSP